MGSYKNPSQIDRKTVPITQPVIFFPGTLCDERIWIPCWEHLDIEQKAYVPLQWADDREQMLCLTTDRVMQFDEKVHLVGFSMGGLIASLYTLDNPDKIASLTLIGYNSEGLSDTETKQRQHILQLITKGQYSGFSKQRLNQFIHADHIQNKPVVDAVIDMSEDLGPAVLRQHIQAATPRPSLTKPLAQLDVSITLIGAQDDLIAPPDTKQKMQKAFKNSRLHIVQGSAHMMLLEQPKHLADILCANILER